MSLVCSTVSCKASDGSGEAVGNATGVGDGDGDAVAGGGSARRGESKATVRGDSGADGEEDNGDDAPGSTAGRLRVVR